MLLTRKSATALVIAAAVMASAHACSSDSDEPAGTGGDAGATGGQGGAGASGGVTWDAAGGGAPGGSAGTGAAGSGGGTCGSQFLPAGVPDDWEEYGGYACGCGIYWPGAKGKMPDPVQWEPCGALGPKIAGCQRMATPWSTSPASVPANPRFWFDSGQSRAYVQFGRNRVNDDDQMHYRLVADVDGPILNALMMVKPKCIVQDEDVWEHRYAYVVSDTNAGFAPQAEAGALAGTIGSAPSFALRAPLKNGVIANWRVSKDWIAKLLVGIYAEPWPAGGAPVTVYDPSQDPEGMPKHLARPVGEAVFFEVGGGSYRGIMSWTPKDGPRPLVRYIGDWTQGAGNFSTDGHDMVWTHGTGKAPNDTEYPVRDIMTAPLTADPDVLKTTAKRLRSDPGQLEPQAPIFGVGCGHAARKILDLTDINQPTTYLLVVRIADGVSWRVDAPLLSTTAKFIKGFGATCTEIFALYQFPDDATSIVRFPIASLGPGTPPD